MDCFVRALRSVDAPGVVLRKRDRRLDRRLRHGGDDEVSLREGVHREQTAEAQGSVARVGVAARALVNDFSGDHWGDVDSGISCDGRQQQVGPGGGEHRIGVDADSRARADDEAIDRGGIEVADRKCVNLRNAPAGADWFWVGFTC